MNASPVTIFSSFGPGYAVAGDAYSVGAPAAAFTATGDYVVSQLDLSLNWYQGTNSMTVSLLTDSGNAPGALLGSWVISGLPNLPYPPITTISGITGVTLAGGTTYFLQVSPGDVTTQGGWLLGPSIGGLMYFPSGVPGGGNTITVRLPAFDVVGTAVPEPNTATLLTLGVASLVACAHRSLKRKARRGKASRVAA